MARRLLCVLDMSKPNANKLEIKMETVRKLTNDELGGIVGGLPGGTVLNSETGGLKVTYDWYKAKLTIGARK